MTRCQCDDSGFIPYSDERAVRRVAACLCDAGRRKLAHTLGIERVLSDVQLRELYGGAVPVAKTDRYPGLMRDRGVPDDWSTRTLDSYRAAFSSDVLAGKYVSYLGLWAKKPAGDRMDVVLYGPNGTGKSGLAVGAVRAALEAGASVRFASFARLAMDWRGLFRDDASMSEAQMLASLVAPDVLLIDDVSAVKASEFIEQTLTMIVDERQKVQRATILTLNVPAQSSTTEEQQFLASLLGPMLFDRLKERAAFYPCNGASKRAPKWRPPVAK